MPAPKGHLPYNQNGEGGRPPIYTDEYIEKELAALIEWIAEKPGNIFLKRFTFERGYTSQRISEFSKRNKRFAEAVEKLNEKREFIMMEGGLSKKYQASVVMPLLSILHGIREDSKSHDKSDISEILFNTDGLSKELVS